MLCTRTSVPNLEFDCLAVKFNCSNLKIYTNGGNITFGICIISKTQQEAGFSNTLIMVKKLANNHLPLSPISKSLNKKSLITMCYKTSKRNVQTYYSGFIVVGEIEVFVVFLWHQVVRCLCCQPYKLEQAKTDLTL